MTELIATVFLLISLFLPISFILCETVPTTNNVHDRTLSPDDVRQTINQLFNERHESLWKHTVATTLNNDHIEEMNKSATYDQFNIFYRQYKISLENWLKEYLGNELKFKILDEQRPLMTSQEFSAFKGQMDLVVETCRATLWKMLQEMYKYIELNFKHYVDKFQDKYESDEIIDYEQMVEFVKELGKQVQKQIAYR
uniref:Uncharacterized protein n=1 Tax=Cacopsylla melanoneura TaxID=428564 RepID=A0A8D8SW48_9HEMI